MPLMALSGRHLFAKPVRSSTCADATWVQILENVEVGVLSSLHCHR